MRCNVKIEEISNPKERKNWKYRVFKKTKKGFEVLSREVNLTDAKRMRKKFCKKT